MYVERKLAKQKSLHALNFFAVIGGFVYAAHIRGQRVVAAIWLHIFNFQTT